MKKKKRSFRRSLWRFLRIPIFLGALLGCLSFLWGIWGSEASSPKTVPVERILHLEGNSAFSRFLGFRRTIENQRRQEGYTELSRIPVVLRQAVVAVEDRRFYSHPGFDVEGILRAVLVNAQSGEIEEGASTITQQLAKNLFLTQERTFQRKAEELALACALEIGYSKDEILELYLNTIYFGSGSYGIQAAAEEYFAKEPEELSLSEASMLAGLPNAPSLYSPYADFLLAKKRQFIVLDAMEKEGYISKAQSDDAKIQPILLAHE